MTSATATDSTAFDITDWLGEWESFEHYVDSGDATIQQTWEADEQAVLANPKMALMAARGIKTFWSMACSTTSRDCLSKCVTGLNWPVVWPVGKAGGRCLLGQWET